MTASSFSYPSSSLPNAIGDPFASTSCVNKSLLRIHTLTALAVVHRPVAWHTQKSENRFSISKYYHLILYRVYECERLRKNMLLFSQKRSIVGTCKSFGHFMRRWWWLKWCVCLLAVLCTIHFYSHAYAYRHTVMECNGVLRLSLWFVKISDYMDLVYGWLSILVETHLQS